MTAVGAFTVTKENVEDDRALLKTGVIGTGTEVGGVGATMMRLF